jgi:hypothetical protein
MTSLTHLPKNDAARAITNREQSHKMRSKNHLSRPIGPFINTSFGT